MVSERRKKVSAELAAVRHVITSPEWAIFRNFVEKRLRAGFAAACMEQDDSLRLRHMAGSEAILLFMRDFELKELECEKWLSMVGFENDSQEAAEREAARTGQNHPRPYRED